MSGKMSKSRAWALVTIVFVAVIVALGLGLGLGLNKKEGDTVVVNEVLDCPPPPTSARLTKASPIYVQPTYIKEGAYRFLSVASDSEPCSKIGTEMMVRHGGSAVDAAITSILCAGIYHPQSCGVGGGFFMTYYKRSEKTAYSILAREMAPSAAKEDMFLKKGVSSREGGLAIGIPGEVKGLYEAWRLGGKLPWKDLFQPVISMCLDGFVVGDLLHADIQKNTEYIDRHGNLKSMLTNSVTGELFQKGETMRLPRLAQTLQKIADDPHTFYNGSLASDVSDDIMDQGGIITTSDLKQYTAAVKTPLSLDINGGYKIYAPPPPSSGAIILLILNILNGYKFDETDFGEVNATVESYHTIVEAFKHAYAVRTNLGDGDAEDQDFRDKINQTRFHLDAELASAMFQKFLDKRQEAAVYILLQNVTDSDYAAAIRTLITDATHDKDYYNPTYAQAGADAGTSHLSVIGPNGDAVSVTSTINLYFGSKIVGSRTGIVFNDEMDDFSTPGTVNYFGIPASPANFIKPFKRPMSSMSPSIVVDGSGDVRLVTGASGGSRIITATAMSAINTLWFKMGMKEAIDYPRIHHQLVPEHIRVEKRMPQAILDGLADRGHKLDLQDSSGSAVQAILQRSRDELYASCDPTKYGVTDGC